MVRPHTTYKTLAALFFLGVMAVVFASLGQWQLDRAAQREAIKLTIDTGRNSAPLTLNASTAANELVPWRSATVSGTWNHDLTVLLENRNYKGKPGYWVATPLILNDPAKTAVLVLRGWMPRPLRPSEAMQPIPEPVGHQIIQGELLQHVPRLFELWSWSENDLTQLPASLPAPDQPLPSLQNLDIDAYANATGLKFMPVVLAQTEANDTQLLREWPEPSLDSDKNRGYALQWYGFATIAAGAWLVVAWRALRRRGKPNTL